jgi:hypothetical protein
METTTFADGAQVYGGACRRYCHGKSKGTVFQGSQLQGKMIVGAIRQSIELPVQEMEQLSIALSLVSCFLAATK